MLKTNVVEGVHVCMYVVHTEVHWGSIYEGFATSPNYKRILESDV